jgi:NADH dehydrogenase FAD-containing subunit
MIELLKATFWQVTSLLHGNQILRAFEMAETEENSDRQKALRTFVMVGAGPTGVEMASAIAIFRRIDPNSARIVLADNGGATARHIF